MNCSLRSISTEWKIRGQLGKFLVQQPSERGTDELGTYGYGIEPDDQSNPLVIKGHIVGLKYWEGVCAPLIYSVVCNDTLCGCSWDPCGACRFQRPSLAILLLSLEPVSQLK